MGDGIQTPIIDREIGKRVSQTKRAYTKYRSKHMELVEAVRARERPDIIAQIAAERRRLAIRVMKAQSNTERFVSGLNELLVWDK